MKDIKAQVQDIDPNTHPKDLAKIIEPTGNIYEALAICAKRATLLTSIIREELHAKLEEFAVEYDSIEEIQENKEQIEISKFYERLPNPAIIAMTEYLEGDLGWRYNEKEETED